MRNKDRTLKRDNNECYICKSIEKLEIHHIHARRSGGLDNIDNLITLCRGCHRNIESGIIENAVYKCVKRALGINNNSKQENNPKANCKNCGEEFTKIKKWKVFCSNYCRNDHYNKTHPRIKIETD